jgi:hypothetical protein
MRNQQSICIINGKQKTNFSVDQLSQALELTSSDETSLEKQKDIDGETFGNTDTEASDESED